jgi:small subunit ribosomal protein S1
MVLNTDPAERRIRLGLKQVLGDPWQEASKRFPVGAVVEGSISNLAKFGAFVDLGDGLEGMIHIGDITNEKHLDHPSQVLSAGQTVRAAVLEVDAAKRRIRLGMKQLQPTAADEYIAEHSVGDAVTGRVVDARANRVKVDLGEGVVAACRAKEARREPTQSGSDRDQEEPDLAALSAMLASRWKQGAASAGAASSGFETGQVREFRIVSLDGESKRIEVEPL